MNIQPFSLSDIESLVAEKALEHSRRLLNYKDSTLRVSQLSKLFFASAKMRIQRQTKEEGLCMYLLSDRFWDSGRR